MACWLNVVKNGDIDIRLPFDRRVDGMGRSRQSRQSRVGQAASFSSHDYPLHHHFDHNLGPYSRPRIASPELKLGVGHACAHSPSDVRLPPTL